MFLNCEKKSKDESSDAKPASSETEKADETIATLDLDGQKGAQKSIKDDVKQKKIKKPMVKPGQKKPRKEIKKLKHQLLDVNTHPLRNASFISTELRRKSNTLQKVYNRMLKKSGEFSGTLYLSFYIKSSGKTSQVRIRKNSDIKNKEFRKKIIAEVRKWRFPKISRKYSAQKITYPATFKKSS
jgi:hypothetical protein